MSLSKGKRWYSNNRLQFFKACCSILPKAWDATKQLLWHQPQFGKKLIHIYEWEKM
jgi:hypothetical protein